MGRDCCKFPSIIFYISWTLQLKFRIHQLSYKASILLTISYLTSTQGLREWVRLVRSRFLPPSWILTLCWRCFLPTSWFSSRSKMKRLSCLFREDFDRETRRIEFGTCRWCCCTYFTCLEWPFQLLFGTSWCRIRGTIDKLVQCWLGQGWWSKG